VASLTFPLFCFLIVGEVEDKIFVSKNAENFAHSTAIAAPTTTRSSPQQVDNKSLLEKVLAQMIFASS
jgi:hypothetical protein